MTMHLHHAELVARNRDAFAHDPDLIREADARLDAYRRTVARQQDARLSQHRQVNEGCGLAIAALVSGAVMIGWLALSHGWPDAMHSVSVIEAREVAE